MSALGPNPSFFLFWETFIQLGVCWDRDRDLDQGLTIVLEPQKNQLKIDTEYRMYLKELDTVAHCSTIGLDWSIYHGL